MKWGDTMSEQFSREATPPYPDPPKSQWGPTTPQVLAISTTKDPAPPSPYSLVNYYPHPLYIETPPVRSPNLLAFWKIYVMFGATPHSGCVKFTCMTEISCTPEVGVPLVKDELASLDLSERVHAAANTVELLERSGAAPEVLEDDGSGAENIEDLARAFAQNPEEANKALTTGRISAMRPAVIQQLDDVLREFNHVVVRNAVQIRTFVTNKLILEASNPDPRVRIRALELLGKISDVGLFAERSEVTITHRSTDELKQTLREKLNTLRMNAMREGAQDITPVQEVLPEVEIPEDYLIPDLDAELGLK